MAVWWTNGRFFYAVNVLAFIVGISIYINVIKDGMVLHSRTEFETKSKTKFENKLTQDGQSNASVDSHQFKSILPGGDWFKASHHGDRAIGQLKNGSQNTNQSDVSSDEKISPVEEKKVQRLPQALGIGAKKCGTGIYFLVVVYKLPFRHNLKC